jgi:hypothetical protein
MQTFPMYQAGAPQNAPGCWGRQFEGDKNAECKACAFNWSCKKAFEEQNAIRPQALRPYQPQYPQQIPMAYAPPPPPTPQYRPAQTPWPAAPPQFPQQLQYGAANLPVPREAMVSPHLGPLQHPNGPILVPGAQVDNKPNYIDQYGQIFGQYPNESTAERLGKNVILRMAESLFSEIWRFFHFWTWPKIPNK